MLGEAEERMRPGAPGGAVSKSREEELLFTHEGTVKRSFSTHSGITRMIVVQICLHKSLLYNTIQGHFAV